MFSFKSLLLPAGTLNILTGPDEELWKEAKSRANPNSRQLAHTPSGATVLEIPSIQIVKCKVNLSEEELGSHEIRVAITIVNPYGLDLINVFRFEGLEIIQQDTQTKYLPVTGKYNPVTGKGLLN